MILKLFYILLISFFFCEVLSGENQYPSNVKKVVDCRPSLPDQNPNQSSSQLNTDGLVSQSLKDENRPEPQNLNYPYIPKKTLYPYGESDETDAKQNKNSHKRPLTLNKDSNEESRQGNNRPQKQTESTELSKLVEKCITTKLREAKKNRSPKQLDSEEFSNNRRSNSNDSNLEDDSLEVLSRSENNVRAGALADPAQGVGLRPLTSLNSDVLLLNNKKVCYACTSANNPNCWVPDRYTTVKYCNRQNEACLTKTYNSGNGLVVIRDCGNSCVDNSIGVHPEYKSCSICHDNLCNDSNGAFNVHINMYSLIFGLFLITFVKRVV